MRINGVGSTSFPLKPMDCRKVIDNLCDEMQFNTAAKFKESL